MRLLEHFVQVKQRWAEKQGADAEGHCNRRHDAGVGASDGQIHVGQDEVAAQREPPTDDDQSHLRGRCVAREPSAILKQEADRRERKARGADLHRPRPAGMREIRK